MEPLLEHLPEAFPGPVESAGELSGTAAGQSGSLTPGQIGKLVKFNSLSLSVCESGNRLCYSFREFLHGRVREVVGRDCSRLRTGGGHATSSPSTTQFVQDDVSGDGKDERFGRCVPSEIR